MRKSTGCDSEPTYRDGGFGGSLRSRMSEPLQRRLAQQEATEDQAAAKESRRQQELAASYQERAIAAAVQEAHARGEMPSVHEAYRTNGASLGHTVSEFIADYNARMDLEDLQHEAEERRAFNKWQLERSAEFSADTSAPSPAEKAEAEETAARAERVATHARAQRADARKARKEADERDQRTVRYARSVARLHDDGLL